MTDDKSWKRGTAALALGVVAVLTAAGCGGGSDDNGTTAAAGDTGTTTSSSTDTTATAAGTGGKSFANLRVTWAAPDYLDPGLSYTVNGWQIMWNVYLPLLSYKHVGGPEGSTIVPALAKALPEVTNGGTVYKMTLRDGLTYSDGKPVKASDFAYSIKRLFLINSPGVGFFTGIVGADEFAKTKKGEISGIKTDDAAGTVQITLKAPQGDFQNILGTPFAAVVPTGTPAKDRSTNPIPATGPYQIQSYRPNRSFVVVRNPKYKPVPGIPVGNPDKMTGTIVDDDTAALQTVLGGNSDYDQLTLPPDRLDEITTKYKDQLKLYTPASVYYIFMNHRLAPFNKKAVRQAVNFAIDRDAMVQLFGGLGTPTENFLPVSYPSYKKITVYKHDVAKAKQLVKQAGATGAKVTVWGSSSETSTRVAQYVADVLNDIGMSAKVKTVARGVYWDTIGNQKTKAQIGNANWYQDYPHPLDWIDVLMNGTRITDVHNNNYGNVDVPAVNQEIATLKKQPSLNDATNASWAALDRKLIVDDAAAAPYLNEEGTDFFSPEMNLQSCYINHVLYNWDFAAACKK